MKIGIIDTGVDHTHKRFNHHHITGITLSENLRKEIKLVKNSFKDIKGHGTGILSIIVQHAPYVETEVVKLEAENGRISENLLVQAINYLLNNKEIELINISMGIKTNNPSKELRLACDRASKQGVILVAAVHYLHDKLCYPAHFSSVLGVGQGIVETKHKFRKLDNKSADILAKGGFQRVAYPENAFRFSVGTSLATAHFSGIICKAKLENQWNDLDSLNSWIKRNSDNSIISLTKHDSKIRKLNKTETPVFSAEEIYNSLKPAAGILNIAIYPFEEKEMQSILEFPQLFPYQLTLAVGNLRSIKLNQSISLLENLGVPYTFGELEDAAYNTFDTVIIGYFLDKLLDQNSYQGYSLIKECVKRNKNFIVWDLAIKDLIHSVISDSGGEYTGSIFVTAFRRQDQENLCASMEHQVLKSPSICVVGTNKKQGKFTTQLILKELLRENGYKVSHLSTEPQGIVLGADFVFPIGHKSTVDVDIREWNKSLRFLTQVIEEHTKPDIIITGSQGSILPKYPMNDSNAAEMLSYVKAFYPDTLICTISPNDTLDYIKKTTDVIKAFVDCEVLFYVLTPFEYTIHFNNQVRVSYRMLDEDEYQSKLKYFNENLNAPAFNIKDRNNSQKIIDIIINKFSKG
ncbi:hypothetical protein AY601_3523 [Pedobacter cryoconitis]|uniref:Peptidase S8/S53 domain-containing protein n=1 Tax=Pedobacter cryoconitis TaxID=188932 RepID=A0A127VHJ6_9SPHI|nr:S8 family serine peptidase [Pedobacter cryoconitis]AMQ00389.1 hypothetical protein AY601_3523 [Pedobacter cryoconitis]